MDGYVSDVCSRCDSALPEPVEDGLGSEFALLVVLDGGYTMFCDPDVAEEDRRYVLCHDCGHELCDFLGVDARDWHHHQTLRAWESNHHAD